MYDIYTTVRYMISYTKEVLVLLIEVLELLLLAFKQCSQKWPIVTKGGPIGL